MRNITLTFSLLFTTIAFSQTAFFKHLGATPPERINEKIECSCIDGKDRLTVGYYKFTTTDTVLVFKSWNGNQWDIVSKELSVAKTKSIKCIYKDDSLLYVAANYRKDKKLRTAMFYLPYIKTGASNDTIGIFNNGEATISDLKILNKKLVVFGRFDSIWTIQKKWQPNINIAEFEYINLAGYWNIDQEVRTKIKNLPILLPVATSNDTTLLIAFNNHVLCQFIFPDKLEIIRQSSAGKTPYSGVFHLGNKWLITMLNSDSVLYYDGKDFIRRRLVTLGENLSVVNTNRGIFISEDNKEGSRIWKLDTVKNSISSEFFIPRLGNPAFPQSSLTKSKNSIFYIFNLPYSYDNENYNFIVEFNPESGKLIIAYLFNDKNKNYKKDINEEAVNGKLRNRTFGNLLTSNAGRFEDKIPKIMNAEYELVGISSSECLKLPFTGALKTNSNKGENDTLYFPLQKRFSDLSVKSWGTACARLLDTIPLEVKVIVNDCEVKPRDATVTVTLDSNTQLISSFPPFSLRAGNKLIYNLKNIVGPKGETIKLNVLYSNTKFKIDDYVNHHVKLTTALVEDSNTVNTDSIVQKMVYSYDPNAKYSIPQGTIISDLKSIRYYIEFQNEGNADARRVTIVDTLDTRIPVYEFQMVAASHAYSVSLQNNVVTWVFDNINLPPKSLNEKGSQGYVIFDAHIISNIGVGDSIRNKAFIYFDFNEPIVTNLAIIKRIEDLPKIDESDATFRVFPNPATATFTIENKVNVPQNIKVYDMIGQEVQEIKLDPIGKTIQSVSWPKGMYFIRSTKGNFQKFLVH